MNPQDKDHLTADEFEPIELGSAFEETRGSINEGAEGNFLPNTRV